MTKNTNTDRAFNLFASIGNNVPPWVLAVLMAAATLVAIFASGCASPAVSVVRFDGQGELRTDGDHVMVTGDVKGSAYGFAKANGFPLFYVPLSVSDGFVLLAVLSDGTSVLVDPATQDLPEWTTQLYVPDTPD